jgi:hypothetical protein
MLEDALQLVMEYVSGVVDEAERRSLEDAVQKHSEACTELK